MIHKAGVTLFKLVPEYMFINQMIILTVISIVSIVLLKQNKSLKHMRVYIKIPLLLGLITLPVYKIFVYNQFHFELYKSFIFYSRFEYNDLLHLHDKCDIRCV